MKSIKTSLAMALVIASTTTGVLAQGVKSEGWYAGGSVGRSTLKPKTDGFTIGDSQDTSDLGYKVVGGYRLTDTWAVEAQYQDLGKWKYSNNSGSLEAKVGGLSVAAVGRFPIGNGFVAFGKLGAVNQKFKITATTSGSSASDSITKTTPLLGIGLEYPISPVMAVRAEYEYFGVPTLEEQGSAKIKAHTALLSAGLIYRF